MEVKILGRKIFLRKTFVIIGAVIIAVGLGIVGNIITQTNDGFVIEKNKTYRNINKTDKEKGNENLQQNKAVAANNAEIITQEKININTATKDQLISLPAIGEKMAQNIIDYRNKRGAFKKCEDIMKVKGIKKGKYNKFKDKITVD